MRKIAVTATQGCCGFACDSLGELNTKKEGPPLLGRKTTEDFEAFEVIVFAASPKALEAPDDSVFGASPEAADDIIFALKSEASEDIVFGASRFKTEAF